MNLKSTGPLVTNKRAKGLSFGDRLTEEGVFSKYWIIERLVFRLYRGKKLSCSNFPENGVKLFIYLRVFRKRILCTI